MEQQGGGYCSYQINIMKLALALVIIKRKPSRISAKEFATKLAVSFSQAQANWKTKCAVAEKELIYVRQKLLETKLEKELESATNDESSCIDVSCHLMDSQSQGYCSYTQPQLQCDNIKLLSGSVDTSHQELEDLICSHTSFMNKMSTITNIKKKLPGVTHCDARMIIRDTCMATIKALQIQEINLATLPSTVITDAVDSIIGVMRSQLFGECEEEMVQCVRQLQNKFIAKLSNSFCSDLWNKEVIETLSAAIMNLSTITELAESTVVVLVEHIKTCVKMLQESLKDITVLKPNALDFMAQVFYLLESILKQCHPDQLENLRDTVLNEDGGFPSQLLDEYPLFTYSIWRISAIVNASCNNQGVMKL